MSYTLFPDLIVCLIMILPFSLANNTMSALAPVFRPLGMAGKRRFDGLTDAIFQALGIVQIFLLVR